MTITDAVAQAESVQTYQRAANRLEARSWSNRPAEIADRLITPKELSRLAHHARFAARRNRDGSKPDKWER